MKTQKLLTYLRKCIQEYDLIQPGDKIAVGLSGGKDSAALLYGLALLQKFYPVPFSLVGITVDVGFHADFSPVEAFCQQLQVPYILVPTQISQIVFEARKEDHPCSLCSNMRRGAFVNAAIEAGCTKIALGHHMDDYLDTLLMSLIYEGRFYSFAPHSAYENRKMGVIRPLLYVSEGEIRALVRDQQIPLVANPCPEDHKTKREEMKDLLETLRKTYPNIKKQLFHALTTSEIPDWVACRNRQTSAKEDQSHGGPKLS